MEFNYSYKGNSSIDNYKANETDMSFVPDASRQPTFFSGELAKNIEFREAMSSLHHVVVSDLRFKPKDKTAYKEWAAQQEQTDLIKIFAKKQELKTQIEEIKIELNYLYNQSHKRLAPYHVAKMKYFAHLYLRERDAWFVLDPVITVHPDEIFFECFSQDESTYGKLGVSYEGFKNIKNFACGTTNIDYSEDLYQEFQKIRSYKKTIFEVDPSGFEVKTTNEEDFKEVKIDLPDSWVRGFLQVSSAMSMPSVKIDLHPMDLYNICFVLKRQKEKSGPRSMRYILKPNQPVKVVFDPWGIVVECPRSVYYGNQEQEIRVWGRRRILILERLIQIAKKFTVHLLGQGMPSFYIADLGHMSFTLGLSGWTANDWSGAGNFDLMTSRKEVDEVTRQKVFDELKSTWYSDTDILARRLNMDKATVLSALNSYTQAGRAIFDLNKNVYRVRELSKDPLLSEKLKFSSPKEEEAAKFVQTNKVKILEIEQPPEGGIKISGSVSVTDSYNTFYPTLVIDNDERIKVATCTCNWYTQNKLYKGPCEHMLALRMQHKKQNLLLIEEVI